MHTVKLLRNLLALGFSVTDLARLFGVSTQAVSQWVHGSRQPSASHLDDLLTLHALAVEHIANGGAVSDFVTGKLWSPHTNVLPDGHEGEIFRHIRGFTPAQLEQFKAGDALPPRDRTRFGSKLNIEITLEDLAQLATVIRTDPSALDRTRVLDDLYHATGILRMAIQLLYWGVVYRVADQQASQEEPNAHKTS